MKLTCDYEFLSFIFSHLIKRGQLIPERRTIISALNVKSHVPQLLQKMFIFIQHLVYFLSLSCFDIVYILCIMETNVQCKRRNVKKIAS